MALFEYGRQQWAREGAPLAARLRPQTFDEFVGQEHILGPDRVLRRTLAADRVPSFILWGPPGSGKTTLANLVAGVTHAHFEPVSAVTSGVADLRRIIAEARERQAMYGQRTILFVDEIHRFNKAQQDVILPHVEDGTITFIGATTENPSFEVNAPLLSRCRVFTLHPLSAGEVETIIHRALADEARGLGKLKLGLTDAAMQHLVNMANGDARVALNALEIAASAMTIPHSPPLPKGDTEGASSPGPEGSGHLQIPPTPLSQRGAKGDSGRSAGDAAGPHIIDLHTIADALQRRSLVYDRAGESHYDTISAFIKSVRGSSPDGALYWLARMIEAGEDPLFIARRLVILAAEDIGLAEPEALAVAVAAQQAVHFLGMPEGRIPLAEATVYLATAPKSNSAYMALERALEDVRQQPNEPVPLHLRNAGTGLMQGMGYGKGYHYAHDYPGHFVEQEYLPPSLKGRRYYQPAEEGREKLIAERLKRWWEQ